MRKRTKKGQPKGCSFFVAKKCTKTLGTTCEIFLIRVGEGPILPAVENKK